MVASANIFYIATDYQNEANMKVVAGNIQLIVVVCMTVVQRKISKDLTRTYF